MCAIWQRSSAASHPWAHTAATPGHRRTCFSSSADRCCRVSVSAVYVGMAPPVNGGGPEKREGASEDARFGGPPAGGGGNRVRLPCDRHRQDAPSGRAGAGIVPATRPHSATLAETTSRTAAGARDAAGQAVGEGRAALSSAPLCGAVPVGPCVVGCHGHPPPRPCPGPGAGGRCSRRGPGGGRHAVCPADAAHGVLSRVHPVLRLAVPGAGPQPQRGATRGQAHSPHSQALAEAKPALCRLCAPATSVPCCQLTCTPLCGGASCGRRWACRAPSPGCWPVTRPP